MFCMKDHIINISRHKNQTRRIYHVAMTLGIIWAFYISSRLVVYLQGIHHRAKPCLNLSGKGFESRRKLFSLLTSFRKQVESYDLDPTEQSRHFANFSVLWMGFCLGAEQKNIYMPVIPKYIPVIFHNELQQVSIKLPGCNEKLKHINFTWFKLLWQNDRHN